MTSSGIPYFTIGLAIVSLMYISLGPVVDQLNGVHIDMSDDAEIPMSRERADAWGLVMLVWDNIPVIELVGFVFLIIMVGIAEHSGPTY